MAHKKALTLSIVIPVFNEQRYLKACLDSIAAQTVMPDEVVVVDNNSTDKSVQIASTYSFVTVLFEKHQHQVFAQTRGFNAAKSDILGRIDADSILPVNWVENVKRIFRQEPGTIAITGSGKPYDLSIYKFARFVFNLYCGLLSFIVGQRMLWGANCALRRNFWLKVRQDIFMRSDIWEDCDLSICLAKYGKLRYIKNKIDISVSFRTIKRPFIDQLRYQFRLIRVIYLRKGFLRACVLMVLWYTMLISFPVVILDQYVFKPLSKKLTGHSRSAENATR